MVNEVKRSAMGPYLSAALGILHRVRSFLPSALLLAFAGACAGPEASDAALCRDVIHRVCLAPRCAVVDVRLGVGDDCEVTLLGRTGCADESFALGSISRDRFLDCRASLLSGGDGVEQHPPCQSVSEMFDRCPEMAPFLNGSLP
jgi:hypothetical protein